MKIGFGIVTTALLGVGLLVLRRRSNLGAEEEVD